MIPNIANDLHQFDVQFGLPDPAFNEGESDRQARAFRRPTRAGPTEIALDVEWAHAIAPKANILLVEAASSSISDLMTAVNTRSARPAWSRCR